MSKSGHDEQKKVKEHEGSMCGGQRKTFTMAWRRMEDGSDEEDTRFLEIQMWEGEEDEEHVLVTWDLRRRK